MMNQWAKVMTGKHQVSTEGMKCVKNGCDYSKKKSER